MVLQAVLFVAAALMNQLAVVQEARESAVSRNEISELGSNYSHLIESSSEDSKRQSLQVQKREMVEASCSTTDLQKKEVAEISMNTESIQL